MDVQTPLSRQDLHAQLDELLDCVECNGGQLHPSQLFLFALNIAYGRGVAEHYHQIGIEETDRLKRPAIETDPEYQERQYRVYTLNILYSLLTDLNVVPPGHDELSGGATGGILPSNFALSPLLQDCVSALAQAGQTNSEGKKIPPNSPLIFQIETTGQWGLRPHARIAVVQAIYYQVCYRNITVTECLASLEPELSKKTFERWVAEAGGAEGALVTAAKQAGRDGA